MATTISNEKSATLGTATIKVPLIALATSWAVLEINNAVAYATISVTCDGYTNKITIGTDGSAKMSLYPFIINAVSASLDNPIPTDGSATTALNKWRGVLSLTITDGTATATIQVPYIYGGAHPTTLEKGRYLDFIAEGELGSWATLELATWYNANGTISSLQDWQNCNINLNNYLSPQPTTDTTATIAVVMFCGGDIVFDDQILHLHYDCRVDNMVRVKWLDAKGGINTRQFTCASESRGGATSSTYTRHQWQRAKDSDYWAGADKWGQRAATRKITLGDDGISAKHFSWIASLVESSCVEVWMDGVWQRCNIADSELSHDPRKGLFSVTLTFELAPIYELQQF